MKLFHRHIFKYRCVFNIKCPVFFFFKMKENEKTEEKEETKEEEQQKEVL